MSLLHGKGGIASPNVGECFSAEVSQPFLLQKCCRSSLNVLSAGEGEEKDTLTVLKCNFLAELFIGPSAAVASGILSGEMPLKLITSMPLFASSFHFSMVLGFLFSRIC